MSAQNAHKCCSFMLRRGGRIEGDERQIGGGGIRVAAAAQIDIIPTVTMWYRTVGLLLVAVGSAAAAGAQSRTHCAGESHIPAGSTLAGCNGSTEVSYTLSTGVYYIESTNYPALYNNYEFCSYIVEASDGSAMDFGCDEFRVEYDSYCDYDYLAVNDTLYCGATAPPMSTATWWNITFKSDYVAASTGWRCWFSIGGVEPSTTPAPVTSPECTCGVTNGNGTSRIVGGNETMPNEIPWQVGLVWTGYTRPFCGGSIINSWYVLTAAHCVDGSEPDEIEVMIGEHDLTDFTDGQYFVTLDQIIEHPLYDYTGKFDVALVKLTKEIAFLEDNLVAPVCLPTPEEAACDLPSGTPALVSGWGTLTSGGSSPDVLNAVDVPLISQAECSDALYNNIISHEEICAGNLTAGGVDSCQGDSGGPLMTMMDSMYYTLIGVVSWGYGCALAGQPGVYGGVADVLPWILNITANDGHFCSAPSA